MPGEKGPVNEIFPLTMVLDGALAVSKTFAAFVCAARLE